MVTKKLRLDITDTGFTKKVNDIKTTHIQNLLKNGKGD